MLQSYQSSLFVATIKSSLRKKGYQESGISTVQSSPDQISILELVGINQGNYVFFGGDKRR